MKQSLRVLAGTLLIFSCLACSGKPVSQTPAGDVVATVNGTPITNAQLLDAAQSQLSRFDTEIYRVKSTTLNNLIDDQLIAAAAKQEGKTVAAYLQEQVNDKVSDPTDAEMKALYDARKTPDMQPYDKIKPQIAQYLKATRMNTARNELISRLRAAADVKIMLEPPRVAVSAGDSPSIGNKNAKVTVIEFSDYQCPFCNRVRPTVQRLLKEYGDKILYVFRDFPLSFHADAPKAHEAAHCAGDQGKYFEYSKMLFERQQNLKIADLKKYAQELKLNTKKFDQCLDSGQHTAKVQKDLQDGMAAGVSGTPAYFINGISLSGAQPYESFTEIIDGELKR